MDSSHHPKITIATVIYNAERTLQRTLDSVAGQAYPHIEHLIIDGCSKDRSMELIHRYVDDNTGREITHDIVVVREPDKGLYDAMNKALENATGDYIVFLNAGDRLHSPDTLKEVFGTPEYIAGTLPAVVYGETDLVDENGQFLRHRRLQAPRRLNWRSFRRGMLVCHQSFYVRTDLARQEPYDLKYRYSADFDWCIRLLKRAGRLNLPIVNSRRILTDYLCEGLTTSNRKASLWERFHIMVSHYGRLATLMLHGLFVIRAILKK